MKLHDLRETRANKIAELRAIVAGAESAGRDLNEGESTRFSELKAEAENIEARIGRAESLADMERRAAATPISGELARESRAYSVAKAIQEFSAGRLTGREAEVQTELSRGREMRGLAVPADLLLGERRDGQTVGTDPAGGYLVPTMLGAMQDRFRPAMKVEALGATVLRGLVGHLDLPNLAASGDVHWIGENENTTRSAAEFEAVAMGPKTVSAEYRLSRRLMLQSGESIENILRADLGALLAGAIDKAAIAGAGVKEPIGILSTSGVTPVTASALLVDTTADLIEVLDIADAPASSRGFLTNGVVGGVARKVKDTQEHVIPLNELFHAQRIEFSNNVPANLGGANNKSALLYGEWSQLVVGYWSAIDIVPNIYHSDVASSGGMLIHAFCDLDVAVRNPAAFAFSLI